MNETAHSRTAAALVLSLKLSCGRRGRLVTVSAALGKEVRQQRTFDYIEDEPDPERHPQDALLVEIFGIESFTFPIAAKGGIHLFQVFRSPGR